MEEKKLLGCAIFDMDGCLVDTEVAYIKAWNYSFQEEKVSIDPKMIDGWAGVGIKIILREIEELTNDKALAVKLWKNREKYFFKLLEAGEVKLKPYTIDILEYLRAQGVSIGLASSTFKAKATRILDTFSLSQYFDFLVFGDEVSLVKPAPDIYFEMLTRSKMNSDCCIVFEDSVSGVKAAASAGFKGIIHIPDISVPPSFVEEEVFARVKDFQEGLRIIEKYYEVV